MLADDLIGDEPPAGLRRAKLLLPVEDIRVAGLSMAAACAVGERQRRWALKLRAREQQRPAACPHSYKRWRAPARHGQRRRAVQEKKACVQVYPRSIRACSRTFSRMPSRWCVCAEQQRAFSFPLSDRR